MISANQSSAFRELRLAAGYEFQETLSRKLGVTETTVSHWDIGTHRPRWRHIRKLAELFNIAPEQLIKILWHQDVGSQCSCGCGNKRVLPDYDGALHLCVNQVCTECGNTKIYNYLPECGHPRLCDVCRSKKLLTPRSTLRKLRLAAGYKAAALAERLSVREETVTRWSRGAGRPCWLYMPKLAGLFKIDINEALTLLWNESVGDPCSCGCGGEKVLPDTSSAKHLYVNLPCQDCGKPRTFRSIPGISGKDSGARHTEFCRRCSDARRKVERVRLRCVGYRPYPSVIIPLRAKRCQYEQDFLPGRIANVRHKKDDGDKYPFVDLEREEYRCRWCAGAFRLLRATEKSLRRRWADTHPPTENYPRIRSADAIKQLQKTLTDQAIFKSDKPKPKRGKGLPRLIHPAVPERRQKWRREKRWAPIRGLCSRCDTLVVSYNKYNRGKPVKFHRQCAWEYQRERYAVESCPRKADGTFLSSSSKPIPVESRRGRAVKPESLQRHFDWTVRYKLLNESLGEIVQNDGFAKSTVVEGINFIMKHLPAAEWVPLQIRQRILALRSYL